VLAAADAQVYRAKAEGRDRVCVDPEMSLAERRRYRDGSA
jgi:hypothetical protein